MTELLRDAVRGNVASGYCGLATLDYREWLVGDVQMHLFVVRAALGSSRRRMLAQFLTEHSF